MSDIQITAENSLQEPILICFLGPDGSGKSTAIEAVIEALEARQLSVSLRHLKPTLWGKQRVAARGVVTDPHSIAPRGSFASIAKLGAWIAETWIDRWQARGRRPDVEIFDRYFYDIEVDPRRYRYGGPAFAPKALAPFVPRPDLVFILDAPAEIIQQRKQEVTQAETARQVKGYRALAERMKQAHLIDATLHPDRVRDTILGLIETECRR